MTCSTVNPSANLSRMKFSSSTAPLGISQVHVSRGSSPHPPQAHLKFLATAITFASSTFLRDDEIEAGDEDNLEDLSSLKKLIPNFTKRPRRRAKPMTRVIAL